MRRKVARSLLAGILLAFISEMIAAFLALLVWYRDKLWEAEISIPALVSVPLLIPIQRWGQRHLPRNLDIPVILAIQGLIYGAIVFASSLLRDAFLKRKSRLSIQSRNERG